MPAREDEIFEVLQLLVDTRSLIVDQLDSMICVLTRINESQNQHCILGSRIRNDSSPVANRETLSAEWQGRSCFLGNTLVFWFFDRLAQTPNRYVSHQELMDQVWGGERNVASIRGVAKRLRDRLSQNGLDDLAACIDGSEPGYFSLTLV